MRAVLAFLLLACALTAAALWQEKTLAAMRAERENAIDVAAGELLATPVGALAAGEAVVLVGRPSGVDPIEVPRAERRQRPQSAPAPGRPSNTPAAAELPDFELEVRPGQTLSEIAKAHYGSAATPLVEELARYNGVDDPDRVAAGMRLRLPAADRLESKIK